MSSSTPLPRRSLTESSCRHPLTRNTHSQAPSHRSAGSTPAPPHFQREVAKAPARSSGGNPVTRNRRQTRSQRIPPSPSPTRSRSRAPHRSGLSRTCAVVTGGNHRSPVPRKRVRSIQCGPISGRKWNPTCSSRVTGLSECFLAIWK